MSTYRLRIGEMEYEAEVKSMTSDKAHVVVNGSDYVVELVSIGRPVVEPVRTASPVRASSPVEPKLPRSSRSATAGASGSVRSPMPGLILRIDVKEGDSVKAGQILLVMEAMKMENTIPAPHNGTVRKVLVTEGASVGEGDVLVEVARPEMTTL